MEIAISVIVSSILSVGYCLWLIKSKKERQDRMQSTVNEEKNTDLYKENILAEKTNI